MMEKTALGSKLKARLKQDVVLSLAIFLALASSCYSLPKLSYIDFGVLGVLLALMLVVAGLKEVRFLDWLAIECLNLCRSRRQVSLALVGISFFASMFVTNDVALLTFVPLALVIGKMLKMDMARVVIIQTMAANLGSMLLPAGNPQNLFLFASFSFTAWDFFQVMTLPTLFSALLLLVLVYRRRDRAIRIALPPLPRPKKQLLILYLGLLLLNIAAVLRFFPKELIIGLTLVLVLVVNRSLFAQVDYGLLFTFSAFFIFIGNISQTSLVRYLQEHVLSSATGTYLAGVVASQFLSNVPAAMLLAGLTKAGEALLLGVNIGGLGTLIASMASVISYKLFTQEHPYHAGTYLRMFLYYNFGCLLLLGALGYGLLYLWF